MNYNYNNNYNNDNSKNSKAIIIVIIIIAIIKITIIVSYFQGERDETESLEQRPIKFDGYISTGKLTNATEQALTLRLDHLYCSTVSPS